jgi:NAD(P)-dependent dehydrogenase (short-subunit alcohol dehydrogenase family)
VRFDGATVLVTGGGRGIGRAIAVRFAEEGARVAIVARTEAQLARTAEEIGATGKARCLALPADVTAPGAAEAAVAKVTSQLGPIDVLVNNAGVFVWRPFLQLSPADWDRVLATNLTATASFCRAVLPAMVERRSGKIVNVSSVHGLRGDANLSAHSAAKFGVIGLTQSLAREFRGHNIAVNAVCPGAVDNRIDETADVDRSSPLSQKLWPSDVAKTVLYLASDEAAGITGAALEVLGGTHITIQG